MTNLIPNKMLTVLHDHPYYHHQYLLKYSCRICKRSFRTEPGLKAHKKRHSATKKHACSDCRKRFYTRADLYCHNVVNHALQTGYYCKLCHTYWICQGMYVQHMRTHYTEKRLYHCTPCGKSFKTIGKFRVHQALHYEKMLQGNCQICLKSFMHSKILNAHKCVNFVSEIFVKKSLNGGKTGKGKTVFNFSCNQCSQLFASEYLLNCHLDWSKWVDNTSKLTCNVCMREFNYHCKLQKHTVLAACRPRSACLKCGETFTTDYLYKQHVTFSKSCGYKMKKFVCPDCGQQYHHQCLLNRHRQYKCDDLKTCVNCERTFLRNSDYIRHITYSIMCGNLKHKKCNKHLKCDECGCKFAAQKTLDAHKAHGCRLSFKKKVTYECSLCKKILKSQSSLEVHMISHTKEKKFEGVKCNENFLYKSYLTDHYRQNAECGKGVDFPRLDYDPEKWMCEYCGRVGFKNRADLSRHMLMHSGKTYVCKTCGAEFPNITGMRTHMKNTCFGIRVCTTCGRKGFKNERDYFNHMSEHDPKYAYRSKRDELDTKRDELDTKFSCPKCAKIMPWKSDLNYHIKQVCSYGLSCKVCGKVDFRTKIEFRKHMFQHDPHYSVETELDSPFPTDTSNASPQDLMCLICFKTLKSLTAKNKHIERVHVSKKITETGTFLCNLCHAILKSHSQYKNHQRSVHCVKVPCERCGKLFAKRVLPQHMRTHTGETPYHCDTCGKQFKTRSHLHYHRKKQTCTATV